MATLNVWISACAVLLLCGAGQSCPSGWSNFNSRCFKVVSSSTTFNKAEMACKNENAHLASVHSYAENEFVRHLVRGSSAASEGAWIGGSDAQSVASWRWTDGSVFDYFGEWASGQPDNYQGSENCLMLTPYGNLNWNDLNCDDNLPYVCSKPSS